MASPATKRMTLAEFPEWDDGTDRRYEVLDGIPVTMAPSLEAHGELALALGAEIRARLRPPCRVISEAGIVIPDRADTNYTADLEHLPIGRNIAGVGEVVGTFGGAEGVEELADGVP